MKCAYVYILASGRNGTLYIGITTDLLRRLSQHRDENNSGFTGRYGVRKLVHVETLDSIAAAIQREKNLKKWPRKWKLDLIEKANPQWRDLWQDVNR